MVDAGGKEAKDEGVKEPGAGDDKYPRLVCKVRRSSNIY